MGGFHCYLYRRALFNSQLEILWPRSFSLGCYLYFTSIDMPKYYCDYCDTYLTHDSPSVRKTHCAGRKHKENVKFYYQKWMEEQAQSLIDATTAAFQQGKITPSPFPGGPPPGGPPRPGMLPTPPMAGPPMMPMMGPPPHGMMPGGPGMRPPMGGP